MTEHLDSFSQRTYPIVVAVGGFTSEVGKTTLLCDLLRAFPGWEAIKTTRGHYRSCGKDPQACCVSHLLEDKPVVRSGEKLTYASGKDTGRYWEAGAANVHWVIATDEQVEVGIQDALGRVRSNGVFVEGNSFTNFIKPDFFVMVVRTDNLKIKATAKNSLELVNAFYLSGDTGSRDRELLCAFLEKTKMGTPAVKTPALTLNEFPNLVAEIARIDPSFASEFRQTT